MNIYLYGFYYLIYGFIINFIFLYYYINNQLKHKTGESIKDFLTHHQNKKFTPNKGGIGFFITLLPIILYCKNFLLMLIVSIGFILGLLDDLYKKKGGIKSYIRFGIWTLIGLLLIIHNIFNNSNNTLIIIPFINIIINLKYLYIPFSLCVFLGGVNGVGVTDGLDGMVSFPLIMNFIFLSIVAICYGKYEFFIICITMIGILLSFLFFNMNKAKIFMSDCGSIFSGMLLSTLYILLKVEIFLLIVGGIFAINIISTTLQVYFIRTYKKKLFLMAPLHHHFELLGFQETTIVFYVWWFSIIFFIIGLYGFLNYIF